ncbi:ABC transporter ATP-binding protein [Enterococcus sp. JM4C]|uniref:ABC transporter ATP-binding protein/permease n=1 Tax=Candidatus Enterococcus huntleyi TaxID=1857217 RepID=UPI00137B29CE|nr:ABC transporter ATP-binding protein/permease [Enterococcus sp. JM4C]KAF1297321.1 ABC transporter ATP-binding protein [Enterococcus sp. JM4C]
MIDKRLFQLTEKRNLFLLVAVRLLNLLSSIALWWTISVSLTQYFQARTSPSTLLLGVLFSVCILKVILAKLQESLTFRASSELRLNLRKKIMEKAFRLGKSQNQLPSATLAQLSVDGIEQLEIYYARFLPQLFYCLIASLMIFVTLSLFAIKPALILLICMPLIPLVIMSVMKIAKRILSGYWTTYTDLGAKFHENLSGLSTLKAYNQDETKQTEAATNAEKFRKVTMSLLSMQLNSITIMDIVSYCGAASGIGVALFSYQNGQLSFEGMLMFLLLSAEFFIPMRQLGSLFHVAMNGISACKKLFTYLELKEPVYGTETINQPIETIALDGVSFRYTEEATDALKNIQLTLKKGQFTAIVGKSGSGKSTLVRLLLHQLTDYTGAIYWNHTELRTLAKETILNKALLVDNHSYLYPKTIKENLLLGNPEASEEMLWQTLEQVQLTSFVRQLPQQLDEVLYENGDNLSGGQRQRLLLARALLKETEIYIFDEITSGVDLASEKIILSCLKELAKTKIVLFISHRLYNVLDADQVMVFDDSQLVATGTPKELNETSAYFKNYFADEQTVLTGGSSQ